MMETGRRPEWGGEHTGDSPIQQQGRRPQCLRPRPGCRGLHTIHSASAQTHSSFDIARAGMEVARVSYRVLRFPDGAQDTKIIVTESGAGGFLARTTDSKWIEVLDVQLF